ncbi:MAG: CBS domain-containing protein [Caldimonas sp.]
MITASPQTTVYEAARLMLEHAISAVLVVDGGALAGIFTERDAVFRVVAQGRDAFGVRLGEVMTPKPLTVDLEMTFGRALLIMQEHRIRHLPVVADGRPVGIVSARDALDPELEDFVCEERRRESLR